MLNGMGIAKRIREARGARGWTQRELARRMGLSDIHGPMQISHWENGHKEPTVTSLIRLATELGVSVDYLAGLEPMDTQESDR